MKFYVVRLNPDLRKGKPYSSYPTTQEYEKIHSISPMNGFDESVNFLSEDGIIKGYLPPKHAISLRDGKPFTLITITAKTAKKGGDQIIGIQFNCRYLGGKKRVNIKDRNKPLFWHYTCCEDDSLIFEEEIRNAREIILGQNLIWHRTPTIELNSLESQRVLNYLFQKISVCEKNKIKSLIGFEERDYEEEEIGLTNEDLTRIRMHKIIERDQSFIQLVKAKKGYICNVCEINLEEKYGEVGKRYIEAHHLTPVSVSKGRKVKRDIDKDFAVLCPNCHRMIHRSDYIHDIETFKKLYFQK